MQASINKSMQMGGKVYCGYRKVAVPTAYKPFSPVQEIGAIRVPTTLRRSRIVFTKASSEEVDFDKVLNDLADKFEKSDNKAAVIGYSAAAVGALWVTEWLIHLPLLNFLLGFPIQLLGLTLTPYFVVKYFVDGESLTGDAGRAADRVIKKLPGFDK